MNLEVENLLAELFAETENSPAYKELLSKVKANSEAFAEYKSMIEMDKVVEKGHLISPTKFFTTNVVLSYDRQLKRKKNNQLLMYYSFTVIGLIVALFILSSFLGEIPASAESLTVVEQIENLTKNLPDFGQSALSLEKIGVMENMSRLMNSFSQIELMIALVIANMMFLLLFIEKQWRKSAYDR
jgi:hypothetical protein